MYYTLYRNTLSWLDIKYLHTHNSKKTLRIIQELRNVILKERERRKEVPSPTLKLSH